MMKLIKMVMDERVKHRLTGVLVIASIAIIFVPAMIKKSNQHIGEHINVSVKLPPKPMLPNVAMVKEKAVFDEIKVAHLDVPTIAAPPKAIKLVKNTLPNNIKPIVKQVSAPVTARAEVVTAQTNLLQNKIKSTVSLATVANKNKALKEDAYVVQVAAFSQEHNAELLVSRLRSKGYQANYNKRGDAYKVVVGRLSHRDDARVLQKQLAENMQLNGLIIKAEVS